MKKPSRGGNMGVSNPMSPGMADDLPIPAPNQNQSGAYSHRDGNHLAALQSQTLSPRGQAGYGTSGAAHNTITPKAQLNNQTFIPASNVSQNNYSNVKSNVHAINSTTGNQMVTSPVNGVKAKVKLSIGGTSNKQQTEQNDAWAEVKPSSPGGSTAAQLQQTFRKSRYRAIPANNQQQNSGANFDNNTTTQQMTIDTTQNAMQPQLSGGTAPGNFQTLTASSPTGYQQIGSPNSTSGAIAINRQAPPTGSRNNYRAPPLHISQNFKNQKGNNNAQQQNTIEARDNTSPRLPAQAANGQGAIANRIASMEPPPRKMTLNQAGGARGQTIVPVDHTNDQIVMATASNNAAATNNSGGYQQVNKFTAQMAQRKSRGKPQGQSVEPPNLNTANNSISGIPINGVQPNNWQNKRGVVGPGVNGVGFVQSPTNLNATITSNQSMSLRDQLYTVKNSMSNRIQFSQANLNSRGQALQSPRPIGASSQAHVDNGPTSLSSKLTNADTNSMLTNQTPGTKPGGIKFPLTPQEASRIFHNELNEYEKREIFDFPTIYYFNQVERQKIRGNEQNATGGVEWGKLNEATNCGFDTDQQEYHVRYNDHIAYRYECIKKLGKGSFGIVVRCFDHKDKEFVAVKILKNKKRLYKQGLVEAKLIETLNKRDPEDKKNIIKKLDQFVFRKHLVITFELLSVNLYDFIKMNNFQGFSLSLIKRFAIQILISLYFMREHNIVHCDLKPENILLRKINKSGIKIIDFGSGCFEDQKIYTYIQSRFYRAPEIVLGISYTAAIDMWSFGCILYELYVGYPLLPGEDEKDHMALMMEVKGVPPRSVLARATRRKVFFDDDYQPILTPNSKGKVRIPGGKNLTHMLNCNEPDFVDFIDKCIEWKIDQRLTPEQAFSHPFIAKAVNELKCLRQGGNEAQPSEQAPQPVPAQVRAPLHGGTVRQLHQQITKNAPAQNNSSNSKKTNNGGYNNGSQHTNNQDNNGLNSNAPNSARSNNSENQSLPRISNR